MATDSTARSVLRELGLSAAALVITLAATLAVEAVSGGGDAHRLILDLILFGVVRLHLGGRS